MLLNEFIQCIRDDERRFQRAPGSVRLLAVTKQQSVAKIREAYDLGQRAFGENYVQEALEKIPQLPTDIEWHFIGHLQQNKAKLVAQHFDWVQSVDNIPLLAQLHRYRDIKPLNICLQVNISGEAQKSGIKKEEVLAMAAAVQDYPHLCLRGLMAIGLDTDDIAALHEMYHELHALYQMLSLRYSSVDTLSLGMSRDRSIAIEEGSTMLRIGSAIFGERV